ncbi:MAG: hypothetical protein Q9222_006316 [Ikaeria aurantiellina]
MAPLARCRTGWLLQYNAKHNREQKAAPQAEMEAHTSPGIVPASLPKKLPITVDVESLRKGSRSLSTVLPWKIGSWFYTMGQQAFVEPIAVVGLSLRLPGNANDVDGLWELLQSGEPAWKPVPADRYNEDAFYHPNADDPNGTNNHPGGHFISGDIRDFDHAFFNYSKSQAAAIDPQQRLLMEIAYEALENAGTSRESVAGTATSVYTAVFPTDYDNHLHKDVMDLPTYYMTGAEMAMFTNRLSHALDLRGPSITLDTACSGGLVALHQACQSLRDGESDTSLVTASNLILGPDHSIGLSNLHLLSSTGRCYPFDERGRGYGRGEGVVALVLKRLDDAIRDRDPIRTVIRSTAIGQDGYTPQNITYPNGQAQADLARTAYARAGLEPRNVAYIEAHGTGTKAGDKEELEAIAGVFASTENRSLPLYVGSIKGAVGHTESVAGLAGFLRAALILEHDAILPVAGFANPKPNLPLDRMQIPTTVIPLPHAPGTTPFVSVSSFGFGGTNAHAILERGPQPQEKAIDDTAIPRLFTLSANSPASLKAMVQAQHDWIEQRPNVSLADLSYTLLHRRSAMSYRFTTVAENHATLLDQLRHGCPATLAKSSSNGLNILMVFTGQGAHWAGMGRELLESTIPSSVFRQSIQTSQDVIHTLGATWQIETELVREGSESRLGQVELVQPISTAIQIALVALLSSQGVRPTAVVGHSSGEIAAAYAAGHLSHLAAIKVAFYRGLVAGSVKSKGSRPGAMLSVGLGEEEAVKYLSELTRGKALIACINSPRSVTVSGDADAVNEVEERIAAANDSTFHRKLPVDTAYHSHHMRAVADDYLAHLGVLDVKIDTTDDNEVAFFSSVTGQLKTSGFGVEYWATNLVSPVRFSEAIQALITTNQHTLANQQTCFIEIGAHPAMSGPVRQCLQLVDMPQSAFIYHAPMHRKVNAIQSTLALAGKLFELGFPVDWDAVSALDPAADTAIVRHDLPAYSWDHSTKHWHESRIARAYRFRNEPYHDLLGVPALDGTPLEPRWRHFLSQAAMPWLADHMVNGSIVFPVAGYCCMAIEGVSQLIRRSPPQQSLEMVALRDISFKRGLVVPDVGRVELQMSMKPQQSSELIFNWSIMALSEGEEWYEHATGILEAVLARAGMTVQQAKEEMPNLQPGGETLLKGDIYRELEAFGNRYGPTFTGLESINIVADASQAFSSLSILDLQDSMPGKHQQPHIIHPVTLESVFQTALALAGRHVSPGPVMPLHVDEVLIASVPSVQKPGSELNVSTSLISSHQGSAILDLSVLSSGRQVLSISGLELEFLESSLQRSNLAINIPEICYEMDWQPSIKHIRADEVPYNLALTDFLAQVALSHRGQSIIGLGATVGLSEDFLGAVTAHNKVASFDFVDTTHGRFDHASDRLKEFPVQYRALRPGMDPYMRGFKAGAYDFVLVESVKWLDQAALLVKPSGAILLSIDERALKDNTWYSRLQKPQFAVEEQLTFRDVAKKRLIIILKPTKVQSSVKVHILTHSTQDIPSWVSAVENGLRAREANIESAPMNSTTVTALLEKGALDKSSNDIIIVVDDMPKAPILQDVITYTASITLLRYPARLVWLSSDDAAELHQIQGVARTAHAENDDLRLTTVHSASSFLEDESSYKRLISVIADVIDQLGNAESPHTEREYRIHEGGIVMVPRLQYSDRLNRAIGDYSEPGPETEDLEFADSQRPLVLSSDGSPLFVDHDEEYTAPLANDMIEVEVQAFVLSKASHIATMGEYAGIVTRIGAGVTSLVSGDRIVAVAPMTGANRLRIPYMNAGRIPKNVPATIASALLLNLMAASYAIRGLARLGSSRGTVLVHGARTIAGRAAVAVARSIGIRVTAIAADPDMARLLEKEIGIDVTDVVFTRPSFHVRPRQNISKDGLDAVIQAGDESIPVEVLTCIKPFGAIIVIGTHSPLTGVAAKLPPNVSSHVVDITGLIHARPSLTHELIIESILAFEYLPLSGIDVFIGDISEIEEALRLVNTRGHAKAVLQVDPRSKVKVIQPSIPDAWRDGNATYLIAGGLGDLGGRLLVQMAIRGAKHLATVSRTVDSNVREMLQAKLESIRPGIHLYALQGDVSSEESIQAAAVKLAQQGAPPVRGIIMAAAVIQDSPLESTTYNDFTNVSKIKTDGTLNLHRVFASPDLAFFLCLSSVSNIVGAPAQATYNAGNSLQDSLPHQEQQLSKTRFLAVNIGWIEDAGLTANDKTRQDALRRAGICTISSTQLTRFFDYILDAAHNPKSSLKQAVIGFDARSLAGATAHNSTIHSSLFDRVRDGIANRSISEGGDASANTHTGGSSRTFDQVLASGDAEAIVDFISTSITTQLARLISIEPGSIDASAGSILALGLDSLITVELRNWIARTFKALLQNTDILADQTVRGLAEKIWGNVNQ